MIQSLMRARDLAIYTKSPKVITSPLYAQKFKAKWHKIYDKAPNNRIEPVYYSQLKINLNTRLERHFPEAGVVELENAKIYGVDGWIFTQQGYLLSDLTWYGKNIHEMKNIPRIIPQNKYIKGVCLTLASDFSINSYGHFLLDCLSRVHLFEEAGFALSDIDYVYCPKPPSRTADKLFSQLNIPKEKCIWSNDNNYKSIAFEKIIAPNFPGTRRNYPKWVPEFLQRKFLSSNPTPSRRLYISRSGCRRNILNESEIIDILLKYEFEIYDPAKHNNQPYDFSEAKIIVGPHGGGLSDLGFCQPGTKVLELIPTDHIYPYYYTLSDAAKLEYSCMICTSSEERSHDAWGPSYSDFYVNVEEFEQALTRLVSDS